jgi:hypothetical protein
MAATGEAPASAGSGEATCAAWVARLLRARGVDPRREVGVIDVRDFKRKPPA